MSKQKKIKTLNHRQQSRDKLHVYFGSNDNYLHSIREVVVNARDILQDVENAKIEVHLHDDCKTVSISDNGSGLDMIGETDGVPNYELLFLTLFSGTKMDAGSEDGGTNGCGNTVICYTSDYFNANVKKDGKEYEIEFINGGEISKPLTQIGETTEQGTKITFRLSNEVYTNTVFNPNDVELIVEKICATSSNICGIFKHKDTIKKYNYESLEKYLDTHSQNKPIENIIMNKKTFTTENDEKTTVQSVINLGSDNVHHSFLNGIYLPQHGTIHEGLIDGFKNQLNKFIKDNNLYKPKEKQISRQDIEETISYVISVTSTKVSYDGQTKFSTKKNLYKEIVKTYLYEFLEVYFVENKEDALKIANAILLTRRANEKAEKAKQEEKKKNQSQIGRKPVGKLTDCTSNNPEECEIYLLEGDSAGGNAKQARNRRIQAVLPQRGKSENILKSKNKGMSQDIKNIENSLQCGTGKNYDESKLKFHKVILLADGDSDGAGHITTLWLTYFYHKMKQLIINGHLYIAIPPLYKNVISITKNKEEVIQYTYTEQEQLEYLKTNNPISIQRYKGIGEMSADQLAETTMNPSTRRLIQVTIDNDKEASDTISLLMSDKVEPRYNFIMENSRSNNMIGGI